jgi:hypothetical protein
MHFKVLLIAHDPQASSSDSISIVIPQLTKLAFSLPLDLFVSSTLFLAFSTINYLFVDGLVFGFIFCRVGYS